MMNSTVEEEFPPNPFRSGGGNDPFSAPAAGNNNNAYNPANQLNQQPQQQFMPPQQEQQQNFAMAPQQQQFSIAPQQQQQFAAIPSQQQQNQVLGSSAPSMAIPLSKKSWWETCVGCFNMQTYQAYFDIDTIDVQNRIISSCLTFHLQDHFRSSVVGIERTGAMKGPDLYGPLWITMTLVFLTAVTSNFAAYVRFNTRTKELEDNEELFEYDLQHLIRASTILFTFVFVIPTIYWMGTNCMGLRALNLVDWICYYGYSMTPFLPAVVICMLPSSIWSWLVLLVATAASALLVIKNVSNALLAVDASGSKAPTIVMSILGVHVIFFFTVKLVFFKHD